MENALLIERLYAQRRRAILRLRKAEAAAATERAEIACTESELRKLVLLVVPFEQRKPSQVFGPSELPRLIRAELRKHATPRYLSDIAVAIMHAKGLSPLDMTLRKAVCNKALESLRRMLARGVVTKAGLGVGSRWTLRQSTEPL